MRHTTEISVIRKSPGWFRALNSAWEFTYPFGKISLDRDDMIRSARKMTGLQDLGKDFNPEPLDILLKSVENEAVLHPAGRFITRRRLVSLLSMRLRAEYFFKKYPVILEQELYPAWIIIGLQRTGTTKLQRLLATDPDHRVVYSWEAINPVPLSLDFDPRTNYERDIRKRISVAKTSAAALGIMSPGFNSIHPISIFEPEEDILLLDISFMSTTPEAMMNVPSYAAWLERTDQSEAYAYGIKLLKLLQWQRPASRWVLKSPHHLEFTSLISKHFPKVTFIWPHRTIYKSIPSFLSMVTYTSMIFSNDVDSRRVADHWVRKTGYMLNKAIDFRKDNEDKFIDLFFDDFVRDSQHELAGIYSLNGGLDEVQQERFRQHELQHPHRKYGKHQYSLEDFSLTTEDIDKHTLRYQEFISNAGKQKAEL